MNNCNLYLLKNFPINDYNNVYLNNQQSLQETIDLFLNYCTKTKNVDFFENLSNIDFNEKRIHVNLKFKIANEYNYCLIYDKSEDKWYCCFVRSISWNSNLVTCRINFEFDYFHTYIKAVKFKKSYVEREHVNNDQFGLHVLDEGIPITGYKTKAVIDCLSNEDFLFCVTVSDNKYIFADAIGQHNASFLVNTENTQNYQSLTLGFINAQSATDFINFYVSKNKINSICGFYLAKIPIASRFQVWVFDVDSEDPLPPTITTCWQIFPNSTFEEKTASLLSTVDGYSVINKKCLCFPYNFVNITNNMGGSIKAKYEYSDNNNHSITFKYNFPTQEGSSCTGYVTNYAGVVNNLDMSIAGIVNIELPFVTDTYAAYVSANINAINTHIGNVERIYTNTVLTGAVGAMTGLMGGAFLGTEAQYAGQSTNNSQYNVNTGLSIANYASQVQNAYVSAKNSMDMINASLKDQENAGDVMHGACSTSLMQILNLVGFRMEIMQVRRESIVMIDDYFSRFGYKINDFKIPNVTGRRYFNYVKCAELNIQANIPQVAIEVIKEIFVRGVTIWHDIDKIYDFDFSGNSIV